MFRYSALALTSLAFASLAWPLLCDAVIILAPPARGYDSWNGYWMDINEANMLEECKNFQVNPFADAEFFILDEGWSHNANLSHIANWVIDDWGRPIPSPTRFPSSIADGSLAAFNQMLQATCGMQLGLWMARGINEAAVKQNTPIWGTPYHARDIILPGINSTCRWKRSMHTLNMSHPGAHAYYGSLFALYSSWGVNYVKMDCIGSGDYQEDEILGVWQAAQPYQQLTLSLSPGGNLTAAKADVLSTHSNSWRFTGDLAGCWTNDQRRKAYHERKNASRVGCIVDAVWEMVRIASYIPAGPNNRTGLYSYPDADMLPVGAYFLGPSNASRQLFQSAGMTRFMFGLWSITKTPIILGGRFNDSRAPVAPQTFELMANTRLAAMHQTGVAPRVIAFVNATKRQDGLVVWVSQHAIIAGGRYLGIFPVSHHVNSTKIRNISVSFASLGVSSEISEFTIIDLFSGVTLTSLSNQTATATIVLPVPTNDAAVVLLNPNSYH